MMFGRLPHDPAALARAPSLAGHPLATMAPSPVIDRRQVPFQPRPFWNGSMVPVSQTPELPDCTAAMVANLALGIGALNGFQPIILDPTVPAFYADTIGQPGATLAALAGTQGAVMLDVMRYAATRGFSTGAQLLVPRFGTLAVDRTRIAAAIDRLGGAALGVTLYQRDMDTAGSGASWTPDNPGPVLGGHALMAWSYTGLGDTDTVLLATWGGFQPATWPWIEARTDEAYGMVFDQLGQTDGLSLGVDFAALDAALAGMATATP